MEKAISLRALLVAALTKCFNAFSFSPPQSLTHTIDTARMHEAMEEAAAKKNRPIPKPPSYT